MMSIDQACLMCPIDPSPVAVAGGRIDVGGRSVATTAGYAKECVGIDCAPHNCA